MLASPRNSAVLATLTAALAGLSGYSCVGSDTATAPATGTGAGGSRTTATSSAGGGGMGGSGGTLFTTGTSKPCSNLECQQITCSGGAKTTVSGVVLAPEGTIPLYNVVVYIPNAPVKPLAEGASCDKCGATLSGEPLVTALTDTQGHFVLEDVPVGVDVPLVVQVGKWRRQITLPKITACVDNPITDTTQTRLPRSRAEGDLPRIALTTGGADPLECLLRKIGIDDSEVTTPSGKGRVNLFAGHGGASHYAAGFNNGAALDSATPLWITTEGLQKYDVVLLACEGTQDIDSKPPEALKAMFDYTAAGGRVFASHWHNYWLQDGPAPFPTTATFVDDPDLVDPFTAQIDTSFPKGKALSEWLINVGASTTPGKIVIHAGQHTVDAVNPSVAQAWIYGKSPQSVQYFTFNTPIGSAADKQCGRVVFSDIHVSSGDVVGASFPNGCQTSGLSAQEKALLFMLFDLSSCILDDDQPPTVPQ